jgi:tRNA-splicing ligase RtcB
MTRIETQRLDAFRLRLPRVEPMQVEAEVFASAALPIEPDALAQLRDAACLPGVARVLATPDLHVGYGVPIGAVVAARDFVSPAAVGYDINCGMRLVTTPWRADQVDLAALAARLRRVIPLGEGKTNLRLSPASLQAVLERGVPGLLAAFRAEASLLRQLAALEGADLDEHEAALARIEGRGSLAGAPGALPGRAFERGLPQLGTLGGGNHFVELQRVVEVPDAEAAAAWGLEPGQLVVMIHSGSRGLGHEVGGHFMRLAAEHARRERQRMPSAHLACLPLAHPHGRAFLGAMNAAANYAFANRQVLAMLVAGVLRAALGPAELGTLYDVAHNLAALERHALPGGEVELVVHRKGATRAFPAARMQGTPFADLGQPVLIPGSMGTASWLLRGVPGGAQSLFSTNHGAGRVMSRTAAKGWKGKGRKGRGGGGLITDEEFQRSMQGIVLVCEDRRSIKEEAPAAYKDIDAVIDTVVGAGLAAPVARMQPFAVLKG